MLIAPWDSDENISSHSGLEVVRGDIRDSKLLKSIVADCSHIFHLAAKIDFDGKSYKEYFDVNVRPTKALMEAAAKTGAKKFIFYSTIGVHGLPAGIGPIRNFDENSPPSYSNWYGQSKWEAEEVVRSVHKRTGLEYAIIRPASVYGPREKGPTLALYRAIKKRHFFIIGSGKNELHYVYVRDLVEATYAAAFTTKKTTEYIIASDKPETLAVVATTIARSIHVQLRQILLPFHFAYPVSFVLQLIFSLFGAKAPLYPERVRTMTTDYYYNISKAKNELGYAPKFSFRQGAKIVGTWYKKHGWL